MNYIKAFDAIVDHVKDVSATAKLVFLVLARHMNAEGDCHPSQATLAKKSGLTERSVVKAIGELVARGHLSVKRGNRHKGKANLYRVHLNVVHVNQVQVNGVHVNETPSSSEANALVQVNDVQTKVPMEGTHEGTQERAGSQGIPVVVFEIGMPLPYDLRSYAETELAPGTEIDQVWKKFIGHQVSEGRRTRSVHGAWAKWVADEQKHQRMERERRRDRPTVKAAHPVQPIAKDELERMTRPDNVDAVGE